MRDDLTPQEEQAWHELEEAERLVDAARSRVMEATSRAYNRRARRGHLRLVEPVADKMTQNA
jgi:hypothetical protein